MGNDVRVEWCEVRDKLLAYAEQRGLRQHRITWGWKITENDHSIFHIQEEGRKVGVVPQFRYMEHWYEPSILQELYQRLEHLFDRKHRYFPTIMTRLQEHPEAFSQFCEAFDWFLEQTNKKSNPSRRSGS